MQSCASSCYLMPGVCEGYVFDEDSKQCRPAKLKSCYHLLEEGGKTAIYMAEDMFEPFTGIQLFQMQS